MGCPELAISGSFTGIVREVEMFLLAISLLLIFSVFWRTITNFFHCLIVDGEKLYMSKILKFNLMIKKYNMVYSINNGASIQVQLGLSILEIYVDQHS